MIETLSIFLLLMAVIWILPAGGWAIAGTVLAFGWMGINLAENYRGQLFEKLGLCPRPESYRQPVFWHWFFSSFAVILILAWIFNPDVFTKPDLLIRFHDNLRNCLLWVSLQLLILLGYFANRLKDALKKDWLAALVAALIFGLIHLPNPILTPATALLAFTVSYVFLKSPNLFLPIIAMAILRTELKILILQDLIDHGMRIGPGF